MVLFWIVKYEENIVHLCAYDFGKSERFLRASVSNDNAVAEFVKSCGAKDNVLCCSKYTYENLKRSKDCFNFLEVC